MMAVVTSAARATNDHAPTCRVCGWPITKIHWTWYPKYCSERCRGRYYSALRKTKRDKPHVCRVCGSTDAPRLARPDARYCSQRCLQRWRRPGHFIHLVDLTQPSPPPSNDVQAPTRWTIIRDLPPCDGEDMALCRCAHGHEQAVAIDATPPPDCERCDGQRDYDVTDQPEIKRLMSEYARRLPDKLYEYAGRRRNRYDRQTAAAICALMHVGLPLRDACRAFNLSYWSVWKWYGHGRDRYAKCRPFYVAVEIARHARRTRFNGGRT